MVYHLITMFTRLDKTNEEVVFHSMCVGLLYRHPSQSLVSFYEQLTHLMTKVTRDKKKCYFMGDFNINIPMDEHNDNTCTLLDIMYSMSFIPLITRPTRITSTSATFIFCNILLNNNTRVNGVLYTYLIWVDRAR